MPRRFVSCRRPASLAESEYHAWLDDQAKLLREDPRVRSVALSRLVPLDGGPLPAGVLVEVDVADSEADPPHPLRTLLTDMRLLGFEPALLQPVPRTPTG